jgi:cytochrome c5
MRERTNGAAWALTLLCLGCRAPTVTTTGPEPSQGGEEQGPQGGTAARAPTADGRGVGGRLFDDWARELQKDFVPDDPSTPELDGKGGPFGNGTLPDADGKPLPNPGHDYRLKNLFGWDLRGADGIYGPTYRDKPAVLMPNVLTNTDERVTWIARLNNGEDAIPAYGRVLTLQQIQAIVDFMLAIRDGASPRPEELFELTSKQQGGFRLVPGGDSARGHAAFAETCAHCHGPDGTKLPLDEGQHSLGTLARTEAYETWLKVLNGQPGTKMGPQLPASATRDEQVQALRDLQAALCDRTKYPRGAARHEDLKDGDPRCGAALR